MTVVFSTYQSIDVIAVAQNGDEAKGSFVANPMPEFDLIICDEAHRTAGAYLINQASNMARPAKADEASPIFAGSAVSDVDAASAATADAATVDASSESSKDDSSASAAKKAKAKRTASIKVIDDEEAAFTRIHNNAYVKGKKRLYMTATPKVYGTAAREQENNKEAVLYSMDDVNVFGPVFHTMNFEKAVKMGCLVDYKVIILVGDANTFRSAEEADQFSDNHASRVVGAWKALNKYGIRDELADDLGHMRRAVGFAQQINHDSKRKKTSSKDFAQYFQDVIDEYREDVESRTAKFKNLTDEQAADLANDNAYNEYCFTSSHNLKCSTKHIDGSMNALEKANLLSWLREEPQDNECKILFNVRCLSEGVDVPSLDSVIFLAPRKSQVDVVQTVGCVMRIAPGKKRGYVIIPIVAEDVENPEKTLDRSEEFKVVWQVLNALRSINPSKHIDGSMNALEKANLLSWLREEPQDNECKILFNVRCLSEGVDVPSLDSVIFLAPRKSQVDVVQTVGCVMRIAPGKKRGYVIIPIVAEDVENPEKTLDRSEEFKVVWQVLNALRSINPSHELVDGRLMKIDDRIEVISVVNSKISKNSSSSSGGKKIAVDPVNPSKDEPTNSNGLLADLDYGVIRVEEAIKTAIIKKLGNIRTWEDWAKDVALICSNQAKNIKRVLEDTEHPEAKKCFDDFKNQMSAAINGHLTKDGIADDETATLSDDEFIDMLAQHIVIKPVLDELFKEHPFTEKNAIASSLTQMLETLQRFGMQVATNDLKNFYESVGYRMKNVKSLADRQAVIVDLFDRFFKVAFPKLQEKLGIVYTPIEVVDFINHSVNDILKKEFNTSLGDQGVHILDPFTGTGTFITRMMLDETIIPRASLPYKYRNELHAFELVPLSYYVASINIESVYDELKPNSDEEYEANNVTVLTDTFATHDADVLPLMSSNIQRNASLRQKVDKLPLRVIIGNPPYSAGQSSGNDNNQNEHYPELESLADRQAVIVDLFDRFFKVAFPKLQEKLGIVYTPIEVVDFINHSVNDILKKEFNTSLGDQGVHILDPFTGTGTFITRMMLDETIIPRASLPYKYRNELHAFELVPLSYYVASINIESVYDELKPNSDEEYEANNVTVLTDTFATHDADVLPLMSSNIQRNASLRQKVDKLPLRVIIGNPPYSAGQTSGNDNNQNEHYPELESRLEETYVAKAGKITNKNSLYDSYIKAFRWASDKIGESGIVAFVSNAGWIDSASANGIRKCFADEFNSIYVYHLFRWASDKIGESGIVAFVSNAGWIDSASANGIRKCFADEFNSIYVYHLKGNQRTSGEESRRQGGKIFGAGSRAPIAVTILVKNPSSSDHGVIRFGCVDDYLSREQKLAQLNLIQTITNASMTEIKPDEHGDWLNYRRDDFAKFIAVKGDGNVSSCIFILAPNGITTSRDAWSFNSSSKRIEENFTRCISFYNILAEEATRLGDNLNLKSSV